MTSFTCWNADAGSAADVINGDVPLDAVASVGTQDKLHVPCPVQTPRNRHLGLFPTVSLVTGQRPESHTVATRSNALFEKNSRVTFQFSLIQFSSEELSSVQFNSVRDGICELGKAYKLSSVPPRHS